MKIKNVTAVRAGQFLFARIETDNSIVGWGESGVWGNLEASAAAIEKFAEYLVGQEPRRIELHWNLLQRFAHFRGAAINGAISAIDIALWDIAGQHLGVPIHTLLGGAVRDEARLYGHVYAPTIEGVVSELKNLKKLGFNAVGHLNPFLDEEEEDRWFLPHVKKLNQAADYVRQFREAVGDDMDLLIELHRRLNPAEAVRFSALVEPYEPMWLEDPIRPEFTAEMGELATRINLPIATGERLIGPAEFGQLLKRGPIAYVRTCVGLCGGITGARKIAAMAEAMDIQVAPHNPFSPIGLHACLQIAASAPNFAIQEYPTGFHNLQLQSDGKLLGADLVTKLPEIKGGFCKIPDGPGLGTAVNEKAAAAMPPVTRKVSMRRHRDGMVIDQ